MRQLFSLIMLCGLSAVLVGCAEYISEREGAEIQVVPVTYAMSISLRDGEKEKAYQELDRYIQIHWNKVSTQAVNLYWYTPEGKSVADKYYQYLLGKGIDKRKVNLQPVSTTDDSFDMAFQIVINRSIVEVCDYEKVGNFGQTKQGCYTDNARWQSMVYPEKMLNIRQQPGAEMTQPDRL